MSVRDSVLPVIDRARGIVAGLGFRRVAVTLRRRTWAGSRIGDADGQSPGYTDVVTPIVPTPRVRFLSAKEMGATMMQAGDYEDRYALITSVTPQYTDPADGAVKGFSPDQLRELVTPGVTNVDVAVMLTGDDGKPIACKVVSTDFTKPFRYEITVRLKARDV